MEQAYQVVARQRAVRRWQQAVKKVLALPHEATESWGPMEPADIPGVTCSEAVWNAGNNDLDPPVEMMAMHAFEINGGLSTNTDKAAAMDRWQPQPAGCKLNEGGNMLDNSKSPCMVHGRPGIDSGAVLHAEAAVECTDAGNAARGENQRKDFARVANAMVEQQRQQRIKPHLSKLPPLHLERLQKQWQAAKSYQLNTERAREQARAKQQLKERWAQLKQRHADMQK